MALRCSGLKSGCKFSEPNGTIFFSIDGAKPCCLCILAGSGSCFYNPVIFLPKAKVCCGPDVQYTMGEASASLALSRNGKAPGCQVRLPACATGSIRSQWLAPSWNEADESEPAL